MVYRGVVNVIVMRLRRVLPLVDDDGFCEHALLRLLAPPPQAPVLWIHVLRPHLVARVIHDVVKRLHDRVALVDRDVLVQYIKCK